MYVVNEDGSLMYVCDTIEDKDRGLTSADSPAKVKQTKAAAGKSVTAIPTGHYKLDAYHRTGNKNLFSMSAKYNHVLPEVMGIPGYSGVLIHAGSSANSSAGCIIVGKKSTPGRVEASRGSLYNLLDNYVNPARNAGKNLSIIVRRGSERQMTQAGQKTGE